MEMENEKMILRVNFKGGAYSHYIINWSDSIYVDDKTPLADIKNYLKHRPEVVFCPETFDDVIGIDFFSIANDFEV